MVKEILMVVVMRKGDESERNDDVVVEMGMEGFSGGEG